MVTLVGTQTDFEDALFALCELDYDAIEAYQAAINRIENPSYKIKLTQFMHDHERHTQEITRILHAHQAKAPQGPSMKEYLTQGKVVLANLLGDKAILKAMLTNEEDTNIAYERVVSHEKIWEDAKDTVQRGWADERNHKSWIEATINNI